MDKTDIRSFRMKEKAGNPEIYKDNKKRNTKYADDICHLDKNNFFMKSAAH